MKTAIVLAMHGAPPRHFPAHETTENDPLHAGSLEMTEHLRQATGC